MTAESLSATAKKLVHTVRGALGCRSIVLVGMMGSGKSSIGRRLAAVLELPFHDADTEIEHAAGMTVEDIFREKGEPYFREGEERVIKRLLQSGPQVLATGGGAVISEKTRAEIARAAVSIWLKAPVELLFQRVSRRDNRPLLKAPDPKAVLARLLDERAPFYDEADIRLLSRDAPHEVIVEEALALLASYLAEPAEVRKEDGAAAVQSEGRP